MGEKNIKHMERTEILIVQRKIEVVLGADLFSIGRSSMSASKKSMATTSHNIANANDDNFSRQRVTTETNIPVGEGDYVVGTGTNIVKSKEFTTN